MSSVTCPVEGCIKDVHRGGFCYAHYMKNWRYGTPTPTHAQRWEDLTGKRFGTLIAVRRVKKDWELLCDCGATTIGRVGDLNRGSKSTCGDKKVHQRRDNIGYGAAHDRVRRDRGDSSLHDCADCGRQARQWSYTHADPNELTATGILAGIAYSANPDYYVPRCVPCHKLFDLGRIDAA